MNRIRNKQPETQDGGDHTQTLYDVTDPERIPNFGESVCCFKKNLPPDKRL